MAKNRSKARQDRSQDSGDFSTSPFAALREQLPDLSQDPAPDSTATAAAQHDDSADEAPSYAVERTRKGGWPLRLEKRSGGKVVTVLERVSGDAQLLLKHLKKHCGAGGALRDGCLEMQGDQRAAIERFLDKR